MNGYIGLYKSRKYEVYANTSYEAQSKLVAQLKVKKSWEISVYLCEKDGQTVIHSTSEV